MKKALGVNSRLGKKKKKITNDLKDRIMEITLLQQQKKINYEIWGPLTRLIEQHQAYQPSHYIVTAGRYLGSVQSLSWANFLGPHGMHHTRPPCASQHLEFTQTHVHCVGNAIQPSQPLSSPILLAINLAQHQGLFKWVSSSHQVTKVLEFQLQHQSF